MWLRLLLPLASAAVLAVFDVRRRPALAGAAYGIALVALYGWSIGRSPAFAPLVPSAVETLAALVVAAAGGLLGGMAGRWLANALGSGAPRPRVDARAEAPLELTSPGR